MANQPVIIRAFEKIRSPVEIVGLGDVRMPRGDPQEVEVAVLVASDIASTGFNAELDVEICWMGCGKLDLLVAGSQWRKGIRSGNAPVQKVTATFECDPRHELLGRGVTPCPPRERPYPSAAISAACGFLLRRTSDRGTRPAIAPSQAGVTPAKGGGPELILLPHMELLRGLFGVSNRVLLELFDGIRNPAILAGRGFFDLGNSYQREDGTVVVRAGWALSKDEAIIAAALITDPALRKLYWAPFQQLSKNGCDGAPVGLNMVWPWPEQIKLTLEGRWVTRVGCRPRFLATRLVSIDLPISFTGIEVRHPGIEKGDAEALPPPAGASGLTNSSTIVLVNGASGTAFRRPVEVATGEVAIPTAAGIKIVHVPLGGVGRNDIKAIGEARKDEGLASSAGAQRGADSNVSSASLKRRKIDPNLPTRSMLQALEMTWAALKAACRAGGWTLDALPEGKSGDRSARHGGLNLSVEPLVAKVGWGSSHLVFVDAGSPSADERSVGILIPKSPATGNEALGWLAHQACRSVQGRWSSKKKRRLTAFTIKPFRRSPAAWQDPSEHADLIRKRIASAFAVRG